MGWAVSAEATEAVDALVARAQTGDRRAIARLLSVVEDDDELRRVAVAALAPFTGGAHVVGITGAPGVGKSTLTNGLIGELRSAGLQVGVLAVDPSSPYTRGALLGDRIRMQQHALDGRVHIRSMASRGHLGGLSVAAPMTLRVFDAVGCDVVLVETVGVGQSEVEIASAADTTVVVLAPGMGDGVQLAKAGLIEIGDIFVVNKADRQQTSALTRELRSVIALGQRSAEHWKPPVLSTVATDHTGIKELVGAVQAHADHARAQGSWWTRRRQRARGEVEGLVLAGWAATLQTDAADRLDELATAVSTGELDPFTAADMLGDRVLDRRGTPG